MLSYPLYTSRDYVDDIMMMCFWRRVRQRVLRLLAGVRGAVPDAAARAGVAARAPRAPVPLRPRAGAGAAQPAPRDASGILSSHNIIIL